MAKLPNFIIMIGRFRRSRERDTISALYGTIVAQARLPSFYRDYAIADTVNGRFDLIVLHLVLMLGRLRQNSALNVLGQALFDRFCEDMDHNLREMGVSDLKVPNEMRRMGEAFYGRAQAYEAALGAPENSGLVDALNRNIYEERSSASEVADRLAAYVREAVKTLQAHEDTAFRQGQVRWPNPEN
jgi:cytochrome b pre-mRNA-processing protein 3